MTHERHKLRQINFSKKEVKKPDYWISKHKFFS